MINYDERSSGVLSALQNHKFPNLKEKKIVNILLKVSVLETHCSNFKNLNCLISHKLISVLEIVMILNYKCHNLYSPCGAPTVYRDTSCLHTDLDPSNMADDHTDFCHTGYSREF